MRRTIVAVVAGFALFSVTSAARAAEAPVGPEVTVFQGGASSPDVAYDNADDDFLVVWNSAGTVMGRIVRPDLQQAGFAFPVSEPAQGGPPKVAYDVGRHEFLVVWLGPAGQGTAVYGQRISPAGAQLGANDFLISDAGSAARAVAVADRSGHAEYGVAWDGDGTTGSREIFFRRVSGAGGPLGMAQMASDPARGSGLDAREPKLAYNAELDQYLAAWVQDAGPDRLRDPVMGRLVNAGSGPTGTAIELSGTQLNADRAAERSAPAVAHRPRGGYLVAWTEVYDYTGPWIAGNSVTASGAYAGGSFLIRYPIPTTNPVPIGSRNPALSFDPRSGQFEIVWQGDLSPQPETQDEIFGVTRYDGTDPFQISGANGLHYHAREPAIAYGAKTDEHLVVWTADGPPGEDFRILARRLARVSSSGVDYRAPRVRLRVKRFQQIVRRRGLRASVRCDEPCRLVASARVARPGRRAIKLSKARGTVFADAPVRLRLKAARRSLRSLRRAFRHRKTLVVRVSVRASDVAGNRRTVKAKVRARR
jgi:hypothetical protein